MEFPKMIKFNFRMEQATNSLINFRGLGEWCATQTFRKIKCYFIHETDTCSARRLKIRIEYFNKQMNTDTVGARQMPVCRTNS